MGPITGCPIHGSLAKRHWLRWCLQKMMDDSKTMDASVVDSPAPRGTDFVTVAYGACRLLVAPEFHQEVFERTLAAGQSDLGARYDLKRIPSAASSRVLRFSLAINGVDRCLYYKEYVDRSLGDVLKHMVRASRAQRAFRASMMLAAHGFEAPEIVALGEDRLLLWIRRCFLVTLDATDAWPVFALLSKDSSALDADALRRKRDLVRTLGHTIGRMHACGIVHGDLRQGNILARREDGRWRLFFLDNERTRRFPWVPPRLRRKNLVQIGMLRAGLSWTDRLRFWRAYLSVCPSLRRRHKHWARRVHARTMERLAKKHAPRHHTEERQGSD